MSIFPQMLPSDSLYPVYVLSILTRTQKWLEKKEATEISLNGFYRFLDEMAEEKPFQAVYDSRYERINLGKEEPFKHRRPVWQLVADELNEASLSTVEMSFEVLAGWAMEQLRICYKYRQYEKALLRFRKEVENLGLSFCSHPNDVSFDQDAWDIFVLGEFKEKGQKATETVKKIVDASVLRLNEHIAKKTQ